MTVLETMTGCPRNHDGLAIFDAPTVLEIMTSLIYQLPNRSKHTRSTLGVGLSAPPSPVPDPPHSATFRPAHHFSPIRLPRCGKPATWALRVERTWGGIIVTPLWRGFLARWL